MANESGDKINTYLKEAEAHLSQLGQFLTEEQQLEVENELREISLQLINEQKRNQIFNEDHIGIYTRTTEDSGTGNAGRARGTVRETI